MDFTPRALDLDIDDLADPHQRLVYAVLLRAVRDYQFSRSRGYHTPTAHNAPYDGPRSAARIYAREAATWLFSDSSHPWGSRWCCEVIGVPVSRLRHEILTGRHLDVLDDRRVTIRYG